MGAHLRRQSCGTIPGIINDQTSKATKDRSNRRAGIDYLAGLYQEGTGVPGSQEGASSQDPTEGLCLGRHADPRGLQVSYERGNPVWIPG